MAEDKNSTKISTLVPKYIFRSVIAGDDFTLDSVHLSQSGHKFMADCVWRLVRTAFADETVDEHKSD